MVWIIVFRDSASEMRKNDEILEVKRRVKTEEVRQMITKVDHSLAAVVMKGSVLVKLNLPACLKFVY